MKQLTKENRVYVEFLDDQPQALIRHYYRDDDGVAYQVNEVIDLTPEQAEFLRNRDPANAALIQQLLTGMGFGVAVVAMEDAMEDAEPEPEHG